MSFNNITDLINRVMMPLLGLLLIVACVGNVHGVCEDISTPACQAMQRNDPNVCKNGVIADAACQKFCNRCRLTCYSCFDPVNGLTACNTTQECRQGELCQLREIKSSVDRHYEYTSACAEPEVCDGDSVLSIVGRDSVTQHGIQGRNLMVTCCSSDLCNTPETTTTNRPTTTTATTTTTTTATTTATIKPIIHTTPTIQPFVTGQNGCSRDILVVIQLAATDRHSPSMVSHVMRLLISIVHDIEIGPTANLVELLFVEDGVLPVFHFAKYQTKSALLHGLYTPYAINHRTNIIDTPSLIKFIETGCFVTPVGARDNYANDIILFVDHRASLSTSLHSTGWTKAAWNRLSRHVTVVNIGGHSTSAGALDSLATDSKHILHVPSYDHVNMAKPDLLRLMMCS